MRKRLPTFQQWCAQSTVVVNFNRWLPTRHGLHPRYLLVAQTVMKVQLIACVMGQQELQERCEPPCCKQQRAAAVAAARQ
jgi:hypothetical protein